MSPEPEDPVEPTPPAAGEPLWWDDEEERFAEAMRRFAQESRDDDPASEPEA